METMRRNQYTKITLFEITLTDEALKIISSIEITSDNYAVAWRLLKLSTYNTGRSISIEIILANLERDRDTWVM